MKIPEVIAAFVFVATMGALPATAQSMMSSGSLADRVKQLEERAQVLEDKDAIAHVMVEYGRTIDRGDYVGFGNLYARNGTWSGGIGKGPGQHVYTGPAGIAAAMTEFYKEPMGSFHIFTNAIIDVHGDTATGLSKGHFAVRAADGTAAILATAVYHDEFVREKGRWKFLHRTLALAFPRVSAAN